MHVEDVGCSDYGSVRSDPAVSPCAWPPHYEPHDKVQVYREAISAVLETHAPAKVINVNELLVKCAGGEEAFYRTICQNYCLQPDREVYAKAWMRDAEVEAEAAVEGMGVVCWEFCVVTPCSSSPDHAMLLLGPWSAEKRSLHRSS